MKRKLPTTWPCSNLPALLLSGVNSFAFIANFGIGSYYEGKTFWSLAEYRIRSRQGIERLLNLIALSYSAMTLLPYSDEIFSGCQSASAQETRYHIGQQIQAEIFLCRFGIFLQTLKNCSSLIKVVETYFLLGFRKFQKL